MKDSKSKIAIYPGTFDPATLAHIDIIKKAATMFDEVYVAVARNTSKSPFFTEKERLSFIEQAFEGVSNVKVEIFDGLVVDYAKQKSSSIIIRGIRAVSDFDYEFQMAIANHKLESEINTVFIMPSEDYFYISSRLIKEIATFGGDLKSLVPEYVGEALIKKLSKK